MTIEIFLFIGVLVEFVAILILIGIIIHLSNTDPADPTESEQKNKRVYSRDGGHSNGKYLHAIRVLSSRSREKNR